MNRNNASAWRAGRALATMTLVSLFATGCGSAAGTDPVTENTAEAASIDSELTLEPATVIACELFEPDEIRQIAAANPGLVADDATAEITAVDPGQPDGSDSRCVWTVSTFFPEEYQGFKDDLVTAGVGGEPPPGTAERSRLLRAFAGSVVAGDEAKCFFLHESLCVTFDFYSDRDETPVMPAEVDTAIRARLGG